MPFVCRHKVHGGPQFCVADLPGDAPCGAFEYVRVERPEDLPPADPHVVDVAVLDMNHGWPNLGHDSLLHAVLDSSCDLLPVVEETGIRYAFSSPTASLITRVSDASPSGVEVPWALM